MASWPRQAGLILRKDLRLEAATGEVVVTAGFFAVLVVVISSLAFYVSPETRGQVAAGTLWISIAFATVLSLARTWQRERDEGCLDGLLVAPLAPSAIFAGKALGLLSFLFAIEVPVVLLTAVLFSIDLEDAGVGIALLSLAALPGLAAAGTLFGAMTVRTRARDLVLAVVLFPLLAPSLLAAVVATRELFGGASITELGDYAELLLVFDLVFVAGGLGLFGTLAEG